MCTRQTCGEVPNKIWSRRWEGIHREGIRLAYDQIHSGNTQKSSYGLLEAPTEWAETPPRGMVPPATGDADESVVAFAALLPEF